MTKDACYLLGNIAKLHGFKGEVSIYLDVTNPFEYKELESVFVDINEQLTPFFIESITIQQKKFARVKFEGINTEEAAKEILKKELFLPLSILPKLSGTSFYDHEVVDFTAIDEVHGNIGIVRSIIDNSVNPLIQIDQNGTEILIPLLKNTVTKVDRTNRQLHFNSPEGLVELYIKPSYDDKDL
jgi:16S rRNA processing protein RimM